MSTVTVLEAENDLTASTYLEGLAVRPEQHFKGSVFATVKFEATREVGTGDSVVEIPLAAVDKGPLVFDTETGLVIGGPLEIQFLPDPDGVSGYNLGPEDSEIRDLDNLEDNSIAWSLFVESFDPSPDLSDVDAADLDPVATYDDPGEVLYYEISNIPDGARIVDGTDLIGKTGAELSAAIASADLIGRVVGDAIQLTVKQAAMAHLVVASDADLTESNIDLKAFTREPLTGEQSTQEGTETATVEITAVADKPILSADEGLLTRGLVDAQVRRYKWRPVSRRAGAYRPAAQISIPATVSLGGPRRLRVALGVGHAVRL